MLEPYVLTSSTSSMSVLSSSFATTASYYQETDPIFVARSGSFATTGSNQFKANQFVTGSVTATSFTGSLRGHVVTSSIDTTQYMLFNSSGVRQIDWNNGLIGIPDTHSIDWVNRYLTIGPSVILVDWGNQVLYDQTGEVALDWSDAVVNRFNKYNQQYTDQAQQEKLSENISTWSGHTIVIGNSTTAQTLYYLETDGKWYPVDQTTDTSTKLLGISVKKNDMLLEGDVVLDNIGSPGFGLPVYIREGTTTGQLSTTIPTSGYIRVVGHCYWENGTTAGQWILKLRPSNDWYEI
jgi:hypothetical protein